MCFSFLDTGPASSSIGTDDESSKEKCAINDEEISALEYESDSEEFDSSTVSKRI